MNLSYSLILAFVGIAGPTSAGPTSDEPTSIFVPFENDLNTVRNEVIKYCDVSTGPKPSLEEESVYGPIKDWDVSALTTMIGLFSEFAYFDDKTLFCPSCITCNPPVSNWNVSAVEDFGSMFRGARWFNQDLRKWDVRKGYDFKHMFRGASEFNQDLSKWDPRKGLDFKYMFYGAAVFNQDLSKWDVRKGLDFKLMFRHSGMNHYIGGWEMAPYREDKISVISHMIVGQTASNIMSFSMDEWHQFSNLITPANTSE